MSRHLWSLATLLVAGGVTGIVLLTGTGGLTPPAGEAAEKPVPAPTVPMAASEPPAKPPSGFFFSPVFPPAANTESRPPTPAPKPVVPPPRTTAKPNAYFYGGVLPAGYGAYYGYADGGNTASAAAPQAYAATPAATGQLPLNLFSIVGIPNNSGEILWPLAFRLLPDTQRTNRLLLQTNSQFLAAMGQRSAQARTDPAVIRALKQSLAQLRAALVRNDATLGYGIYAEARDFLNRLDQAANLLSQEPRANNP